MTGSIPPVGDDLETQAREFAGRLTGTVRAVVPGCDPFEARTQGTDSGGRIAVRQHPDTGVPLKVDGEPLLTLKVSYHCSWDAAERFLAVDESTVKVFAGRKADREPLFRYEFIRRPFPGIPGAHLQIHAHRDAIAHVMSRAGRGSRRGRSRADSDTVPTMNELHFPVGGPRFRPCLEDALEMLVVEFGVDCSSDGRDALRQGRAHWRGVQLATATRDDPQSAIVALRELGYEIIWPFEDAEPEGTPAKATAL